MQKFYFFSNEHEPVHVHVKKGGEKTSADPLNSKDEKTAVEFITLYWKEIVEKWIAVFVYKQTVTNTKITKKI